MHHLLPLKFKIGVVVALAMGVSGVANLMGHGPLILSLVVGIVEGIVIYALLRSWRLFTRLPRWVPRPIWMVDLSGEWDGEIHSQWRPTPDASPLEPIPATLDLQQGWGEVVFNLKTDKMHSRSSGAVPIYDPVTSELQFQYFYATVPRAAASADNPPQLFGAARASIRLSAPNIISIRYTDERSPGGDIELRRGRSKQTVRSRRKTATSRLMRAGRPVCR